MMTQERMSRFYGFLSWVILLYIRFMNVEFLATVFHSESLKRVDPSLMTSEDVANLVLFFDICHIIRFLFLPNRQNSF